MSHVILPSSLKLRVTYYPHDAEDGSQRACLPRLGGKGICCRGTMPSRPLAIHLGLVVLGRSSCCRCRMLVRG